MADNQGSAGNGAGNPDPNAGQGGQGAGAGAGQGGQGGGQGDGGQGGGSPFLWKTQLSPDLANSPSLKKFADTKEGLVEAVTSYSNLEKLLGNEKVPLPKSKDDTAAVALFRKAIGVPEKSDGYKLADVEIPAGMKGMTFDKGKFAEMALKHGLTPEQASGQWAEYTDMVKGIYAKAVQGQKDKVTAAINALRSEWGDAYDAKVEVGQMVLNKFAGTKEANDELTALLLSSPAGIKFLATIGDQFSENKIGDFKYSRHSLTPDEAQAELNKILSDPKHPYSNPKAAPKEHDAAIEYVLKLHAVIGKNPGQPAAR